MPCPICNHTMQSIGRDDPRARTWWCQRCGTLKENTGDFESIELPLNLQHIITAAELKPGKGDYAVSCVRIACLVRQYEGQQPTIELTNVFTQDGRRFF